MGPKKAPKRTRHYLTVVASDEVKDRWKAAAQAEEPSLTFSQWCRRVLDAAAARVEKREAKS